MFSGQFLGKAVDRFYEYDEKVNCKPPTVKRKHIIRKRRITTATKKFCDVMVFCIDAFDDGFNNLSSIEHWQFFSEKCWHMHSRLIRTIEFDLVSAGQLFTQPKVSERNRRNRSYIRTNQIVSPWWFLWWRWQYYSTKVYWAHASTQKLKLWRKRKEIR